MLQWSGERIFSVAASGHDRCYRAPPALPLGEAPAGLSLSSQLVRLWLSIGTRGSRHNVVRLP